MTGESAFCRRLLKQRFQIDGGGVLEAEAEEMFLSKTAWKKEEEPSWLLTGDSATDRLGNIAGCCGLKLG